MTTHETFLHDVAEHTMTVMRNDGLYRHLRFTRNGGYYMGFDLVTWPGHLCYTGDMGTYVFSRVPDMFTFFRGKTDGRIDFGYWAEKCYGTDRDGIRRYSEELFQQRIREVYDEFVVDHALDAEESASLWQSIQDEVLSRAESHESAVAAAMEFRWAWDGETRGREVFPDFWEHRLEAFTPRFLWCCYALPWAIDRYDREAQK